MTLYKIVIFSKGKENRLYGTYSFSAAMIVLDKSSGYLTDLDGNRIGWLKMIWLRWKETKTIKILFPFR